MRLVYIYHSGFALEADGFSILIDYFKDSDPDPAKGYVRSELLKRAGTLYILASHFHPDHFNPEVLKWKEQKPDIKYIFSKDILKRRRAKADDAIYLKKGDLLFERTVNHTDRSNGGRKDKTLHCTGEGCEWRDHISGLHAGLSPYGHRFCENPPGGDAWSSPSSGGLSGAG